jgi:hypothetical protein
MSKEDSSCCLLISIFFSILLFNPIITGILFTDKTSFQRTKYRISYLTYKTSFFLYLVNNNNNLENDIQSFLFSDELEKDLDIIANDSLSNNITIKLKNTKILEEIIDHNLSNLKNINNINDILKFCSKQNFKILNTDINLKFLQESYQKIQVSHQELVCKYLKLEFYDDLIKKNLINVDKSEILKKIEILKTMYGFNVEQIDIYISNLENFVIFNKYVFPLIWFIFYYILFPLALSFTIYGIFVFISFMRLVTIDNNINNTENRENSTMNDYRKITSRDYTEGNNYKMRNLYDRATNIEGNFCNNVENQEDLQKIADQIQNLLELLGQTYPANTTKEKITIAGEAVEKIENNPKLMQKIINASKAGSIAALESMLNHPAASFLIAALENLQEK